MIRFIIKGKIIRILATEELPINEEWIANYFNNEVNLDLPFQPGEVIFTSSSNVGYDLEFQENYEGELVFIPYEEGILE